MEIKLQCDFCGSTSPPRLLEFHHDRLVVKCPNIKCNHIGIVRFDPLIKKILKEDDCGKEGSSLSAPLR